MKYEYWFFPISDIENHNRSVIARWSNLPKYTYALSPFFFPSYLTVSTNTSSNSELLKHRLSVYGALNLRGSRSLFPFTIKPAESTMSIFNTYFDLRKSSFIDFFDQHRIDVPLCFYKSRSLRRPNFESPLLKFTNFLMQNGEREQTFIALLQAYQATLKVLRGKPPLCKSWFFLYNFINTTFLHANKTETINCKANINSFYNHFLYNKQKFSSETYYLYNFLWETMNVINPLFMFSVYNVDKNLRKFTRSKTSRYVFVWKYTPVYKRTLRTLRLVSRDIKFNVGHRFTNRIFNTLETLRTNPTDSLVWRINQFSHNYVFKNFKKTLLITLKSTS